MRFHIDPEFKTLIPPLSKEEYAQLEENIKAEGCRDPLVAWPEPPTTCTHCHEEGGFQRFDYKSDGPAGTYQWLHRCGHNNFTPLVLLDGHNRFDICNHHEIVFDYTYAPDTVKTREDAKEWIIENQFGRRNLTPFQRSELSLKKEDLVAEKAKANQKLSEGRGVKGLVNLPNLIEPIDTRKTLAEQAGVSEKTLAKVKHVVNCGPQELIEKARKGEVSIDRAFQEVKREEKRAEHKRELDDAKAMISEERKRDIEAVCDMRVCSCGELFASGIKPDAVITDPPYPAEYLPCFTVLSECCEAAGVPLVAVMCGQTYLPEVIQMLSKKLKYRWTLAYMTPGGQAVQQWQAKVNTAWKPVLLFGSSDEWFGDVAVSKPNDNDKRFHEWGQSESGFADLVERLTKPGQIVCDPFMGAGTTAVVSLAMGRRFVGCDINPEHVETARARTLV